MKKRFLLPVLFSTLFALSFILVPATPALAASVAVSPDSGEADSLIYVTGTGFTPGATVRIYFDYDGNYETLSIGIVASDGTVSYFINVPEVPGDSYEVRVETSYEHSSDFFEVEPEIELSETSALVDERVTIYGTGFRASRDITVKFDEQIVATTATNSRGSFSDTFRVPEGELGSHDVTAYDRTYRLSTRLSVTQSISITPHTGPTGTKVTVNGTGFRDDRDVTLTFDGDEVETSPPSISTDGNGSFTASFYVPLCLNKTPEVEASDGRYTDEAEFTILASINLTPNSGTTGDEITVTGSGFRSNRTITLSFDGESIVTRPITVRTDDTGCFEAGFAVPESTSGVHPVKAKDTTDSATANFTTLSSITLNPTSGPIGAEVTINGSGFGANKVVTIRFSEDHVRTSATDNAGSFTDHFVIPQQNTGNYSVAASDGTTSATTIFTITTSIELNPNTGHVGTLVTVSGTGFTGAVTIRYDDTIVATTTADANGAFSISFAAPESMHGHHTVTIGGTINTIEAKFTMESDPPPVPALVSPENGAKQNSRPPFKWGAVTDPSGITYTLQVAIDDSFRTLILEKSGLTQSQYTLAREEGLNATDSATPYYWRVKAIDGAANESAWSTPRSFSVSFIPQWAIYVLIIAISVAISVLVSRKVWHKGS